MARLHFSTASFRREEAENVADATSATGVDFLDVMVRCCGYVLLHGVDPYTNVSMPFPEAWSGNCSAAGRRPPSWTREQASASSSSSGCHRSPTGPTRAGAGRPRCSPPGHGVVRPWTYHVYEKMSSSSCLWTQAVPEAHRSGSSIRRAAGYDDERNTTISGSTSTARSASAIRRRHTLRGILHAPMGLVWARAASRTGRGSSILRNPYTTSADASWCCARAFSRWSPRSTAAGSCHASSAG